MVIKLPHAHTCPLVLILQLLSVYTIQHHLYRVPSPIILISGWFVQNQINGSGFLTPEVMSMKCRLKLVEEEMASLSEIKCEEQKFDLIQSMVYDLLLPDIFFRSFIEK